MKNQLSSHKQPPLHNTVMKLALVSGLLLSCMFGILAVFAGAFKILG